MIHVLTRVTTKGRYPEIIRNTSAESPAAFMDNIYNDIKDAYKEKAVTIEQIESLADLLTELATRKKEESADEVGNE